jgi:hypothetical protein
VSWKGDTGAAGVVDIIAVLPKNAVAEVEEAAFCKAKEDAACVVADAKNSPDGA